MLGAVVALGFMGACKPKEESAKAPVDNRNEAPHPDAAKQPIPVIAPVIPPPSKTEVRRALLEFKLPTKHFGLINHQPEKYYMFVDRTIQGVATEVWQGGQYGFVRDPKMANDGVIHYSRFHEGMDVAPLQRDAKGEPLDLVFSIADGIVVFVNDVPGKSNYGNYIIVQHNTEDGPFFSLYAHLRDCRVARGQKVSCGSTLGLMGYTGTGITKRRAHVHVELNLLLSKRAAIWETMPSAPLPITADPVKPAPTPILNGKNLIGMDVAGWLLAHLKDPSLKLSDFIRREGAYYKIRVPSRGVELEIAQRYPWLRQPGQINQSWEITLAASSVPLAIAPSSEKVETPTLIWVKPSTAPHLWKSREILQGSGSTAVLTRHGLEFVKLLLGEA
jgi:murein DD-endopeptidase MepM/ murein hydrolase activator NlpD